MAFQQATRARIVPALLWGTLVLTPAAVAAQQNPAPASPAVPGAPAVPAAPAAVAPPGAPPAVTICLTCHGPAGEAISATPGAPPIPRLEGQHADYLVKQLREFKAGKRKNDLMKPVLATLASRQFGELAAHFASQAAERRPPADAASVDRGRTLYEQGNTSTGVPACIGCHQTNGAGAPKYPRLAGQRSAYVLQQLTNFKQGARTNDRAHVMRSIAGNLTDDEMRAVAAYLEAQ